MRDGMLRRAWKSRSIDMVEIWWEWTRSVSARDGV